MKHPRQINGTKDLNPHCNRDNICNVRCVSEQAPSNFKFKYIRLLQSKKEPTCKYY